MFRNWQVIVYNGYIAEAKRTKRNKKFIKLLTEFIKQNEGLIKQGGKRIKQYTKLT